MGAIFRKQTTRYKLNGRHVTANTPNTTKHVVESRKWYGQWVDESGRTRTKSLSTDKGVARSMLAKLEDDVERRKLGVLNSFTDAAQKPLLGDISHLADYLETLKNRGNTSLHVQTECARIGRICKGCCFSELRHMDAAKLDKWLAKEMKDKSDFGVITRNHHLRAIKSFIQWLTDNHKTKLNPFTCLKPLNIETHEARHPRRVLSETELRILLTTTRQSKRIDGRRSSSWRLSGEDRYHLYITAAYTGLRASELASLMPSNFNFAEMTWTLPGWKSKRRKLDCLPLLPELGEALKKWIKSRRLDHNELLWPGKWAQLRRGGKILKRDLNEAGIEYQDEEEAFYDFHCLRGQFATMLVRNEVHPKKAQELMRHSDINLTMKIYAKLQVDELAPALSKLKLPG